MYPDIIPYDSWINSQLSVARHYWGITIQNKNYVVDWIFAKEINWLCKPDLVESKLHMKMQKERKKETKAYYDECKKQLEKKEIQNTITSLPF